MWLLPGLGTLAFAILAVLAGTGTVEGFDALVTGLVRDPALRDALAPLALITELGSTWAVIVVAAAALLLGRAAGAPRAGALGAITIGIGSLLVEACKALVGRARPEVLDPILVETGFSFPSGHATNSMVAYGVLAILAGRLPLHPVARAAIRAGLALLVVLIGLSRVWLGVHHPSDVIAGWIAGGVLVLTYAGVSRRAWPVPSAAAAGEDRAAPRSDPPAAA